MTFQQLLDGAEVLSQSGNPGVSSVEYDSRRVKPGCVFVAMQGETCRRQSLHRSGDSGGRCRSRYGLTEQKPREGVAWASRSPWTAGTGAAQRELLQASGRAYRRHRDYRNKRQEHYRISD